MSANTNAQMLIDRAKQLVRERCYDEALATLQGSSQPEVQRAYTRLHTSLEERGLLRAPDLAEEPPPDAVDTRYTFAFDVAALPVQRAPAYAAPNGTYDGPPAAPPASLDADALALALLRTKSFMPHAVAAFALLFAGYVPGVVATFAFFKEAERVHKATGVAPMGLGCLNKLFTLVIISFLPALLVGWVWVAQLLF